MAAASMATAAGAAALVLFTLSRKSHTSRAEMEGDENVHEANNNGPLGIERVSHRLIQAPATWLETISALSETLRFTYSEALGKWPIGDLAFGINFLLKRQGNLCVENIFGGEDSVQLEGPEIAAELRCLLNLLTLCWHFSKKPFPLFLEETGYTNEDVLLQEPKAGILKPAFTILVDRKTKHFFLLIRGTHSMKDTLTAVTGAVVPFHHSVVHSGGVSNLVLGYAHCGMVAAARWIAKLATPCLIKALNEHPDYQLKVVGHSLGGGTAALLTYILREQQELSTTSCVTFAPAACMTWELAESGNDVITSVINGADLVPTFSAASADDLRAEVTASAWLNDLRNKIEQTRILRTVYHSASALGSHLPSIANARAKVAGAGAVLRPVSHGTQAVMKRAQTMAHAAWARPTLHFSWSCMGSRHRATMIPSKEGKNSSESSPTGPETSDPLLTSPRTSTTTETMELPASTSEGLEWNSEIERFHNDATSMHSDMDVADGDNLIGHHRNEDHMTEVELWHQLEHKLSDMAGEEADLERDIREGEASAIEEVGTSPQEVSPREAKEVHRFFPPGKIMHIITLHGDEMEGNATSSGPENSQSSDVKVGIFLTSRTLYSKLRLSHSMISDHFMPVYRRQIEKLVRELEKEEKPGAAAYISDTDGNGVLL
ncbi:hypothetical protein Ancab_029326 [Ancistrocladus abbreviatus]